MQWLEMAVRLPAAAMQFGIRALSDMWGAVQSRTAQGVDGLVSQIAHATGSRPAGDLHRAEDQRSSPPPRRQCCLNNDCLKLIRYQVLFVKRGLEVAFPTREELVWENLSGLQFQTWKVAEFVSELDEVPVPPKWLEKNYPPGRQQKTIGGKQVWVIHALPLGDEKYLQVRCQLLRSYRRERLKFPERQLEVLAEIRDAIAPPVWTPPPTQPPTRLLPAPSAALPAAAGESSRLASEQEYQAVVASQAVRSEAAQPEKPSRSKKVKASSAKATAKAGPAKKTSKKPTKAKAKAASAKAKRSAKKPARGRKR